MISKSILFFVIILVICFPFLYNFILGFFYETGYILESSIFSINYKDFLLHFWENKSILFSGNDSIYLINYIPSYSYFYLFEILVGNKISGYFLSIIFLLILSILSLNKVLKYLGGEIKDLKYYNALTLLICFLFYTCLSNFIFLQHNIFFYLPAIIFPIQLFLVLYGIQQKKIYTFFLLLILSFLITTNITLLLLNTIFLILFCIFYLKFQGKTKRKFYIYISTISLALLPSFVFVIIPVFLNNLYLDSSLDSTIGLIKEDFYSVNSNIFTIMTQRSFWGLFGDFQGDLYYDFSTFYAQPSLFILGIIPYILVIFLFLLQKEKKQSFFLLISIIVIIFVMLGLHNPIYSFLYNAFSPFQIFRNITKFAPYLQFILCIFIFLGALKSTIRKNIILIALGFSCLYNIPYITYTSYFFENRIIPTIPDTHVQAATYLKKNSDFNDKILLLPIVYNLESYIWNDKKYNVQGNLYDSLLLGSGLQSYRFGELGIGPVILQNEFKSLLIPSIKTPRKLELNYQLFEIFLQNHAFNTIVVTKDTISEYQKISTLEEKLDTIGYQEVFSNLDVSIYKKSNLDTRFIQTYHNGNIKKINSKYYEIEIKNLTGSTNVDVLSYYHEGWNLYLEKKGVSNNEISFQTRKPEFQDFHTKKSGLFNSWKVDKEFIKKNYASEYFRENEDGSIDINLSLYFLPQLSLIKSLYIFLFILIGSILGIWILIRDKK